MVLVSDDDESVCGLSRNYKSSLLSLNPTSRMSINTKLSLRYIDKTDFYQLVDRDMSNNEVKMDQFKGQVLCIVNVASK